MFTPQIILKHLQTYLPQLTDRFGSKVTCTATIITGSPQIVRITKASHGLINGATISVINAKIDNGIKAVTQFTETDGTKVLRFETNVPHDLTLGYTEQIELRGFTVSAFNGYFDLYDVPSSTLFEIASDTLPVLNGNEVLREVWEEGINDVYTISNVSTNTFDITLTDKPIFDVKAIPQINYITGFRMDVAASFSRAEAKYTKQASNDLFLFIIFGDCAASKDKQIESDAVSLSTAGQPTRQKLINDFSIVIFWNTKDDIGAALAVKEAWGIIFTSMLACLTGKTFDTFGQSDYMVGFKSHGQAGYNTAYYAHAYEFEFVYEITIEESFLTNFLNTRALRQIDFAFDDIQDGSNIIFEEE